MKNKKSGFRHPLLFYRRTTDRIWKATLLLGVVVTIVSRWTLLRETKILGISSDVWLYAAGIIAFAICFFAFLSRYLAYVQVGESYLKVVTPFLRFNISFRRIRRMYPVLIQQLFPREKSSWTQINFLQPFYGRTTLVADLYGFPLTPQIMKLFLPAPMFSPRSTGLVFVVPDWLKLSTEFDSSRGTWLLTQSRRNKAN